MIILVCGAHGFIGRHLCDALTVAGHTVRRGVRQAHAPSDIVIDYMRDLNASAWQARLKDVDVVINAVGILCEEKGARFQVIHRDAPIALMEACVQAGVRRFVQISTLGKEDATAPYLRTKREADAWLMASPLSWTILRPSLVIGVDGDSSRFFRSIASLPVVGLPGKGDQRLQPVHIDDLTDAVVRALESEAWSRRVVDIVGPVPLNYRKMLLAYRVAMRMPLPWWLPLPMPLLKAVATIAVKLPQRVFSPDTLRMLEEGNTADSTGVTRLLARRPKGPEAWFVSIDADMLRNQAISTWALPLFRVVLALVWIVTGLLSFGLYPLSDSLALLEQVGLRGNAATGVLYGAALLDCALGVVTLLAPGRFLWRLQIVLILVYTSIITLTIPQFWLHPLGPVLKNLPILAMLTVLDAAENR